MCVCVCARTRVCMCMYVCACVCVCVCVWSFVVLEQMNPLVDITIVIESHLSWLLQNIYSFVVSVQYRT